MPILFGIDCILEEPSERTERIGLVTNHAARLAGSPDSHSRLVLQQRGFRLARLFSPEHGLLVRAPDGAAVSDSRDPLTGLPVVSLYGQRLGPAPEHLADLDVVWFDVPDIGVRFYTYVWTLWHVLEACAAVRKRLVVLDRPNPLSGDLDAAEGPILDTERCSSFLGRAAIPVRPSLTLGELARLWNRERRLGVDLRVIPCTGWNRAMHWPETGLPFVPTSPAMPSYASALLYPGLCLLEATNVSAGRGTELPFQLFGAPWLNAPAIAARLNAEPALGLKAAPARFAPSQNPYAGLQCHAVRLEVPNPKRFRPVTAGLRVLALLLEYHRAEFRWAPYPTAANPTGEGHFERLLGRCGLRESLESGSGAVLAQLSAWTGAAGWAERVELSLLYE